MIKRLLILFATVALVHLSCRDDGPVKPEQPPPHRQQDTTSHEMTWESVKFGLVTIENSTLYDICALNDTDIWAVGKITVKNTGKDDSLGHVINNNTAVHWDGRHWDVLGVRTSWGGDTARYEDMRAVLCFAHDDVWFFSDYGYAVHWVGFARSCMKMDHFRGTPIKAWGTSNSNFYVVGSNGAIAYYNGKYFRSIESGTTTVPLSDVYGDAKGVVWTGGFDAYGTGSRIFLRIDGQKLTSISRAQYVGCENVWASKDTLYFNVGSGIHIMSITDTSHSRFLQYKTIAYPAGFIRGMRGRADNDLFLTGDFATIIDYNGKSWYLYPSFDLSLNLEQYMAVSLTAEKVYIAGRAQNSQALILIGKRK